MKKFGTKSGVLMMVAFVVMQSASFGQVALNLAHAQEAPVVEVSADSVPQDAAVEQAAPADETVVSSDVVAQPEPEVVIETIAPEAPVADVAPASAPSASPALSTDKEDYSPAETATIWGNLFQSLQNVVLRVFGNSEVGDHFSDTSVNLTANDQGSFEYLFNLDNMYRPIYTVVASTPDGVELASMNFTDAPGAAGDLDQCSNGAAATPNACTGSAWQNGNLNSNQAHYTEGDSAPYRIRLSNVPTSGSNTLVIEYDIKHSSKNALDYLTSFDRTETTANPCSGVSPCVAGTAVAIPAPSSVGSPVVGMPTTSFNALSAAEKKISIYNGAITGISYTSQGDLNAAQSATRVTINFTASNSNVVLAWGGHIGTSLDWGTGNSAGGISGSPYHMRFIELNGKGGNQDRSLSAGAIAPPAATGLITGQKFNDLNGNGIKDIGESGLSGWTINLSGAASGTTVTDVNGNYTFSTLDDSSYTVCEAMQSGWSQTMPSSGPSCAGSSKGYSAAISGGNTSANNNFGNTQKGTLVVIKHVVNDNGGVTLASGFTMSVTGTNASPASFAGSESGTSVSLTAGSYSVSESSVSGYAAGYSADCNGSIAAGQTKTCTVTNNDIQPKLTVTKVVVTDNGGTKVVSDFSLSVGSTPVTSGVQNGFNAGSYAISEVTDAGYTASFSGDCDANGNVSLAIGDEKSCTITNNDKPATLIIKKVVINDNGGSAAASDFAFSVNEGASVSFEADGQNNLTVNAGSYSVAESAAEGYTTSYDNCSDVVLTNGGTATCTITNNDQPGTLVVKKIVINDNGGSMTESDFSFSVNGDDAVSFEADGQNDLTVDAGSYSVTEPSAAGYTTSYDNCSDVVVANGGTATCTITNNDQPGTLIVKKHVTNDNGGGMLAGDFTMTVAGTNPSATSFAGDEDGTSVTLDAGSYIADETGVATYNKVLGADCSGYIANGETKTCVISNDDVAPSLTLVKVVVTDNGGSAVATNWTLSAEGPTSISGQGGASSDSTFSAGTYDLSEGNGPAGYTAGDWSCEGGSQNGASINLGLGENATCTITNNDQPGTLHVVKVVDNGNTGATNGSDSFSFEVNGDEAVSFEADGQNDLTVDAGSYSVVEPSASGYTTSYSNCSDVVVANGGEATCTITNTAIAPTLTVVKVVENGSTGATFTASDFQMMVDAGNVPQNAEQTETIGSHSVTESGPTGYVASYSGDCDTQGNVSLALADNKTCTITNTAVAPKLTLVKTVVNDNGGSAVVSSFVLNIDSTPVISGAANTTTVGAHSASEVNLSGYAASAWGGACAADGSITLNLGDNKTCTITNNDIAPQLIVIKHVVNDSGNVALASDFTMNVSGSSVSNSSFAGSESGVTVTLNAGSYSVSEGAHSGYAMTLGANCSGTIAVGETKTCTITNDDIPPATRTQGFWQTHTTYTNSVFAGFGGSLQIGTKAINTSNKLFAGFYSSISKKDSGAKRTALDQARMQLLQQWLATKLNCQAFGCSGAAQVLLANAASAWLGVNVNQIQAYASQLDAYNNSNDSLAISGQGKATPSVSQNLSASGVSFWDVLP